MLFKKPKTIPADCEEIHNRIRAHEEQLEALQKELFQRQRISLKRKRAPLKQKQKHVFVKPRKIELNNSVQTLKRKIEGLTMLTGIEVQSFKKGDHCCIVYNMQQNSENQIKHGLRIEMKTGGNEVTESALPVGFNWNAVVDDYENMLKPEYLLAVQSALLAYYDRLEQFKELQNLLTVDGILFRNLDGSHIEATFSLQNAEDDCVEIRVTLVLDYRVQDIRPKKFLFIDLSEGLESLQQQCVMLKKKPLHKAFKSTFINNTGLWKLVQQLKTTKTTPVRSKRVHPNRNPNNDDTFHPDECSDQGEEE
ncbi:unnamed protein product [Leptosia nina]|uniref:Centromere protein O n=1 Tax=Leptosia nina TaxID=320188 RepID=A0AAV1JKH4_9NEOP